MKEIRGTSLEGLGFTSLNRIYSWQYGGIGIMEDSRWMGGSGMKTFISNLYIEVLNGLQKAIPYDCYTLGNLDIRGLCILS